MTKIISVPPLCVINRDELGTVFEVERDGNAEKVEVWWDRSRGGGQELLFVRQENPGLETADVVMFSLSQLYAAIDAFNRAVEEV